MKAKRTRYPRLSFFLLLKLLLLSSPGGAQSVVGQAVLNDLTFVLGPDQPRGSRREVYDEMYAFAARHQFVVSLTTLAEDDLYATAVRQQENSLLQQSTPVLTITTWYEIEPKVLQRIQVQVNPALAKRLPQATAEQIVTEWLTYYHNSSPITEDALRQGILLALERLDDYLNALPPADEVPPVTFANPELATTASPPLGLDALRYPALQGNYEQLEISEAPYPVAWKALPSGKTTPVLAQVDQSTSFPPGLVFVQNGNQVASQPASQTHQQQLTLTGQAHQQEGTLEVYASDEEDAPLVGKLNTISYDVLPQKLVLVPLNRSISRYELFPLVDRVATIYRQANVDLQVDVSEPLLIEDWDEDHALEDGTTGLLSNYTKEMRRVIRAFNRQQDADKETAYIFLCYRGASKPAKRGYMPKKRPYGFVFDKPHRSDDRQVAKTIAHELGHGLFRLEHSWQTYPALAKGSSDNLMDYQERGTRLHKDQWDAIHNPKAMLGWFQDEEDVSSYGNPYAYIWEEFNTLTSGISYSVYKFNKWVDEQKRNISSFFDFSDLELTSNENKVHEVLTAIKENDLKMLKEYAAEEIITGQDLQLDGKAYDKLIIYLLETPEAVDLKNYRTEDEAEDGYSSLIFLTADEVEREALRIQVGYQQKEALVEYLFGEQEEDNEEVNPNCPSNFCCTLCGRDLTMTLVRLEQVFPNSTLVENSGSEYATLFNTALQTGSFNTCDRQAKLFAQIGHESASFNATVEGKNSSGSEMEWSISKILTYFKRTKGAKRHWFNQNFWDDKEYKDFITRNYYESVKEGEVGTHTSKGTKDYYGVWNGQNQTNYHVEIRTNFESEEAGDHKKYTVPTSEKEQHRKNIFRYAYGGSLGNDDPDDVAETEDGWLYRGKGAIQLTGKDNYRRNQDEIQEWFNMSFNLVSNPDLVATDNTVVVYSAIAYILQNVTNVSDIDEMTIDQFSALVNTGNQNNSINNVNGATDRRNRYNQLIANGDLFQCSNENQENEINIPAPTTKP